MPKPFALPGVTNSLGRRLEFCACEHTLGNSICLVAFFLASGASPVLVQTLASKVLLWGPQDRAPQRMTPGPQVENHLTRSQPAGPQEGREQVHCPKCTAKGQPALVLWPRGRVFPGGVPPTQAPYLQQRPWWEGNTPQGSRELPARHERS